jgi:ribonuclease-3 family protein
MIEGGLPFDIREVPASVLAYIGDAVFELYVRLHVAQTASGGSGDLHRRTVRFVSAAAQSQSMRFLLSRPACPRMWIRYPIELRLVSKA